MKKELHDPPHVEQNTSSASSSGCCHDDRFGKHLKKCRNMECHVKASVLLNSKGHVKASVLLL